MGVIVFLKVEDRYLEQLLPLAINYIPYLTTSLCVSKFQRNNSSHGIRHFKKASKYYIFVTHVFKTPRLQFIISVPQNIFFNS